MEDPALLNKLKSGDEEAFRAVVAKYQKLVLNCAYKFVRNRESAEDLAQEVFLEVFESIHSFRAESQLSTWIYRIAVTKSLNHLKSLKRKKRLAVVLSLFGEEKIEERLSASDSSSPARLLENQERAEVLTLVLGGLPETQRIAFTLSKVDGMSHEEIARVMNTTVPSVESLIHRAKAKLKKKLTDYYKDHLS